MDGTNHSAKDIATKILENRDSGEAVVEQLSTSERVLARVTDGIYRQPSSALRELIANAYDADATQVHILTDLPRFDKIIVRDNGLGMKAAVLAHVIKNIGGSSKRTYDGIELGVTDAHDPTHSPGGRELIGKIGIGIFSVAQLTNHFQIITKVRGEKYRTFADVVLHTYSEDHMADAVHKHEFNAGSVKIWSVPAEDIDAQGTEVILLDIRRSAKEILQSRERWHAVRSNMQKVAEGEPPELDIEPPVFHIGGYTFNNDGTIDIPRNLPWEDTDNPADKFSKLVEAMFNELGGRTNPRLNTVLDNYLKMLWDISLAAPLNYVYGHPFSLTCADTSEIYELSNEPRGQAKQLSLKPGQEVRNSIIPNLTAGSKKDTTSFEIYIDGAQLGRPIKCKGLPETGHALKKPLLMVGKCKPDISSVPEEYRGGELAFEAYLLWTPKIVPRDHNGVLVRIHETSGTLFDETFLKYQISEQNRLRQITAEIFVTKGLDSALNIDRESFNYAHPHYQFIQRWLHGALRQLTNTHKKISKTVRDQVRDERLEVHKSEVQKTAEEEWARIKGDEESPPDISFADKNDAEKVKSISTITYDRDRIFPNRKGTRKNAAINADDRKFEEQIKAVASVLSAYGVFDDMSRDKQQELLRAIVRIFTVEAK